MRHLRGVVLRGSLPHFRVVLRGDGAKSVGYSDGLRLHGEGGGEREGGGVNQDTHTRLRSTVFERRLIDWPSLVTHHRNTTNLKPDPDPDPDPGPDPGPAPDPQPTLRRPFADPNPNPKCTDSAD